MDSPPSAGPPRDADLAAWTEPVSRKNKAAGPPPPAASTMPPKGPSAPPAPVGVASPIGSTAPPPPDADTDSVVTSNSVPSSVTSAEDDFEPALYTQPGGPPPASLPRRQRSVPTQLTSVRVDRGSRSPWDYVILGSAMIASGLLGAA
ncbi:MAG: hypothetical protein AAGF12_13450, partial [Myxococcota bacterium]